MWSENRAPPYEELIKNIAGKNALFCNIADKVDKNVLDAAGKCSQTSELLLDALLHINSV